MCCVVFVLFVCFVLFETTKGNRATDVLSYRAVNIDSNKIFVIDRHAKTQKSMNKSSKHKSQSQIKTLSDDNLIPLPSTHRLFCFVVLSLFQFCLFLVVFILFVVVFFAMLCLFLFYVCVCVCF